MKDTEAQNAITGEPLERLIHVLEEQTRSWLILDTCLNPTIPYDSFYL